ncbi:MAG: DUF1461 domain-containing protein [Gammaproteobacteria bacterium]|nr:MAG: DUF1461 domain-containing protein [Gammaproteobacteria bacterium]
MLLSNLLKGIYSVERTIAVRIACNMKYQSAILNFLLSISLFCVSFYIAWNLNAAANFLYSTWYEVLNLDETISKYAPDNKFKNGFENTNQQQHIELFSGIVAGIQRDGEGLRDLSYLDEEKNAKRTLLTDAEVVHLKDVATLVSKFKYLVIFGPLIVCIVFILMRTRKIPVAKFKRHLIGGVGVILALAVLVMLIGPTKIFYVGHELIFPNNHQWFFYYEESLMSTMMKAPVLFGPIACQLLLLTVLLWLAALYFLQRFQAASRKV